MPHLIRDMDDLFLHLDQEPRRFAGPAQVAQVGRFPRKDHAVRRTLDTWNFSLILTGRGSYRWGGQTHVIAGPSVLTQAPGQVVDYGPDARGWHEVFLIFSAAAGARLAERGLWPRKPWWTVGNPGRFLRTVEDLMTEAAQGEPDPDRVDRLAELAIMEGMLGMVAEPGVATSIIGRLRAHADTHWQRGPDLEAMAAREGWSASHFRRTWTRVIGIPPARYQMTLRLRHAARLLATSDAQVAQVARTTGFEDPLHFSRRFAAFAGMAPTAYRRRYRGAVR